MDGSLLCIEEASGLVVSWDAEDKEVSEKTGKTLGELLECIRDKLLTKKLSYESGMGLVSIA
jgi:hypothetical protein